MLRVSVADVLLPTPTTWRQSVKNPRIQSEGPELSDEFGGHCGIEHFRALVNEQHPHSILFSRWERAVWSVIEIESSVDLFWRYAIWSRSRVSGMMVLM